VQFKYTPDPGGLPDWQDREILAVWAFTFTTGTGAVSGITPVDLTKRRGISDGTLWGDGDDAAGGQFQPGITGELVGAEALAVLLRNNVGTNYAVTKFLEALTASATERTLQLHPASGSGDLSGESVKLYLGGQTNDYAWEAIEAVGNRTLRLWAGGLGVVGLHDRSGGEGGAGVDRLEFNDYHLSGTKPVCRMVPLECAYGDVDPYHNDGIDRALPRWDVCSVENQSGTGAGGIPVLITDQTIADAYSVTTDDVFVIKAAFRIHETDGDSLSLLQISLHDGADTIIWDHAAGYYNPHAETDGDLAYVEIHVAVTAIGAGGTANVTYAIESFDPAANSPFGQPGSAYEGRVTAQTGIGLDFTADTRIRVSSQWAAGAGSQDVRLERLDITRSRRDLWRTNRDDGWYIETGDGRELRIPLAVNVDNDHLLTNAEVWCAVGSGGGATCRLALDLIEYDPVTGNETSLVNGSTAPAVPSVFQQTSSFVAPVTLTCSPANPEMESDKRYYIKVVSEQSSAGGQFQVRHAQINTRLSQVQ
jgi:hypothetical protein